MFEQFKKAELTTTVSQCDMPYDSYTVLTERNLTLYLQQIEEMISTIVTYNAVKRGEVNPAVAAVDIAGLPVKSFSRKAIHMDVPLTNPEMYEKEFAESHGPSMRARSANKTAIDSQSNFSEFDCYESQDMSLLRKRFYEMIEHS